MRTRTQLLLSLMTLAIIPAIAGQSAFAATITIDDFTDEIPACDLIIGEPGDTTNPKSGSDTSITGAIGGQRDCMFERLTTDNTGSNSDIMVDTGAGNFDYNEGVDEDGVAMLTYGSTGSPLNEDFSGQNSFDVNYIFADQAHLVTLEITSGITGTPETASVTFTADVLNPAGTNVEQVTLQQLFMDNNNIDFTDVDKIKYTFDTGAGQSTQFTFTLLATTEAVGVGGNGAPMDYVSLLVAGLQGTSMWMLVPAVVISGAAAAIYKVKKQ